MKAMVAMGVMAVACGVAGTPTRVEARPRIGLGVDGGVMPAVYRESYGLLVTARLHLSPIFAVGLVAGTFEASWREHETRTMTPVMVQATWHFGSQVVQPFMEFDVGGMYYQRGDYMGSPQRFVAYEDGYSAVVGGAVGVDVVPLPWVAMGCALRVLGSSVRYYDSFVLATRVEFRF